MAKDAQPKSGTAPTSQTGGGKQTSLLGFFGKPKPGQAPAAAARNRAVLGSSASASSSQSRAGDGAKAPAPGSASSIQPAAPAPTPRIISPPTALATPAATLSSHARDSSSPLSTPDDSGADAGADVVRVVKPQNEDVGMESDDEMPSRNSRRATKKKVVYMESESEADAPTTAERPSKRRKVEASDDEFEFDDAAFDEADLHIAMSQFESSPEKMMTEEDDDEDEDDAPRGKASKKGASKAKAARPPPKPFSGKMGGGGGDGGAGGSRGASGSGSVFLTQAERAKLDARDKKRDETACFDFLVDLRDAEMHRPDHPEYDPRTVYIPKSAWKDFTPFEVQFWEIKRNHFDTVLFFQKGKFYELYENDAEIGHAEFDLKLTDRVKMKMVGVPEQSFDFWAAKFLAAGYKVGKVEQAETAIGAEMRNKGGPKPSGADKIVRRELASVFTNGTVVDPAFLAGDEASHCVAIKEYSEGELRPSAYGICVLDAATGQFELSYLEDDMCRTKLETLIRQIHPKEILHAKANLSITTTRLLRNILPMSTSWVSLRPDTEFYNAEITKDKLAEFFGGFDTAANEGSDEGGLPAAIRDMMDQPLAMEALGGMIFYLKSLNMDKDLLSQRSFNVYDPIRKGETMILDGQSLSHLEILMNNEGTEEGTLLELLQRCKTPFGKRLFRIWLSMPLTNPAAINARLDAVEDLMQYPTFAETFAKIARSVPDLERIISRIHAGRCKQADFLKVVEAFQRIHAGMQTMLNAAKTFSSASVGGLLGSAPDLSSHLEHIRGMFVLEDGVILPAKGASDECDTAVEAVEDIENQLDEVLEGYKNSLGCKTLVFWHSSIGAKEVYHIQTPSSFAAPNNWTKQSSTKNLARYITPKTVGLIRQVQEARETRKIAFQEFFSQLLAEFDSDRDVWLKTIRVFAELDCLLSLAKASADLDEPRCRPTIVDSEQAFLDFQQLRHPAMCLRSDFISNDVQLGGKVPRQALLTGPNTAGKSTLCRMTAVAVIMAQLGAMVPAASATLSPVDKIQTRMGAYDNMFSSASTFKVELDECSKILKQAGPRSLVILDELGRGTSTYDGMAIAEAVLHHLATHNLPLGFFATHYGALTDDFQYHPNVRCMYMQTQVDNEKREVLPLYKLIPGKAESSYGTHVAHLAGVPDPVVDRAEQVSGEFFESFKLKLASRRKSAMPVLAQADFRFLMSLVGPGAERQANLGGVLSEMRVIREAATAGYLA